jgi:hypothetical protein
MTWICPECGELVEKVPPRVDVTPQLWEWGIPNWSHTDRTPLCPVVTERGYEPAQPQRTRRHRKRG